MSAIDAGMTEFREPEVGDHRAPAAVLRLTEYYVACLQIAVDDALFMYLRQPRANLQGNLARFLFRQRSGAVDSLLQRLAADILHGEEVDRACRGFRRPQF